jgi:hypothetical protein
MPGIRSIVLCLILLLSLAPACSTPVPATVTQQPYGPLTENSVFFVIAQRQRARILHSLDDAGLRWTDTWKGADYTLTVDVGSSRGSGKSCGGTVNNVIYTVGGSGARIMVIKGRGLTGTCTPNVFDDMSRKLAQFSQ